MYKFILFIFIAGFSLVYLGCSCSCNQEDSEINIMKQIISKYDFVLTDSSGLKILAGTLNINRYDDGKISGIYTISYSDEDKFPSHSSLKGNCTGDFDGKLRKGFLNMNPKIEDNNLFVKFFLSSDKLQGNWYNSTITGKTAAGFFSATKIN